MKVGIENKIQENRMKKWLIRDRTKSCALLNTAVGCPWGCMGSCCIKGGEERWVSGPILIFLISSYPVISLGWNRPAPFAWYQTRFGATGLKACLMVLSLKCTGLNLHREDGAEAGIKGKKVCREGQKLPPPRYAKPYFSPMTFYAMWLEPPTTHFYFKYKASPYASTVS